MGRTIRICNLAVAAVLLGTPSLAAAKTEDAISQYAAARLAEIGNREGEALKGYIKLYRDAPDSAVLTDRIFDSAIRTGDMAAALRAVRAQELNGQVSSEAPLLLFADAFHKRNWSMATLAADELSARGNLGFMAPILRSWVNVAQGTPHDLPIEDLNADPIFAYYTTDQRIYFELNAGEYSKAKQSLRRLSGQGGDYTRDALLRAAPVIEANSDGEFADALIETAMGIDRVAFLAVSKKGNPKTKIAPEDGLAALHTRIASALLEQKVNEPALVLGRLANWYSPDSAPAKLVLARALIAQGMTGSASNLIETISYSSPYWPQATAARVAGVKPEAAVVKARDAAKMWPNSPSLLLLYSQALQAAGNQSLAIQIYRDIAAEADKNGSTSQQRAHYRLSLAIALDNAGDWDGARRELNAAITLDSESPATLNYLGYSLLERNENLPLAVTLITKAFTSNPDSVAITDSMGWAQYKSGNYAQAVTFLERAAKSSGNDVTINEHLGDAYWQAGRLRDARYAWRVASHAAEGDTAARLVDKIEIGLTTR